MAERIADVYTELPDWFIDGDGDEPRHTTYIWHSCEGLSAKDIGSCEQAGEIVRRDGNVYMIANRNFERPGKRGLCNGCQTPIPENIMAIFNAMCF